ncbi:hypothetical protein FRB94_001684 [Tulasnella sp. JGI-2019a]|nr:hypothetical protein FRB94_001684 [Tulasnella sp. JGI-2019a]
MLWTKNHCTSHSLSWLTNLLFTASTFFTAMILINEKQEGDFEESKELPSHQPNPTKSSSFPNSGSEVGLLRRYLEQHRRQSDDSECTKRESIHGDTEGVIVRSPGSTLFRSGSAGWAQSPPPFWSPQPHQPFNSITRRGEPSVSLAPPPPPYDPPRHIRAVDEDIRGTWTISDDAAAAEGSSSHSQPIIVNDIHFSSSARPRSRSASRNLKLETTRNGNINATLIVKSNGPSGPLCAADVLAENGCIAITTIACESAKLHLSARTRNSGDVAICLPPSFTGLVRLTTSSSSNVDPCHDRRHPTLDLDRHFQERVTVIPSRRFTQNPASSRSRTEVFIGDVVAEGYLKGMMDEDWIGNLIDIEVDRGRVRLIAEGDSSAQQEANIPLQIVVGRAWGLWERLRGVI